MDVDPPAEPTKRRSRCTLKCLWCWVLLMMPMVLLGAVVVYLFLLSPNLRRKYLSRRRAANARRRGALRERRRQHQARRRRDDRRDQQHELHRCAIGEGGGLNYDPVASATLEQRVAVPPSAGRTSGHVAMYARPPTPPIFSPSFTSLTLSLARLALPLSHAGTCMQSRRRATYSRSS